MSCSCDCHDDSEGYKQKIINEWIKKTFKIPGQLQYLPNQSELLAQDQYAKAHFDEVSRLSGRIETVLLEWDQIIKDIHQRLDKLKVEHSS